MEQFFEKVRVPALDSPVFVIEERTASPWRRDVKND